MRSVLVAAALAVAMVCALATSASASSFALTGPTTASGPSPFEPGCGGSGEAFDSSVLYENAEVEPYVAVNPTNTRNVVGFWQQDRWSDGGSHGLLAGVSDDGGQTWSHSAPEFSRCAGGSGEAGGYHRASDPWVSFGPTGTLHAISISFDNDTPRNAVLASRSTDGGHTWSEPKVLRFDNPRALGNNFNDKESITADPTNANYVYAVWDRLIAPSEHSSAKAYENSVSFHGPTWFARSTDNGDTWEAAHPIFDPKAINQTIGNQIVVEPNGTLVDGFNLINGAKNAHGTRGYNVAILRSTDKGQTWEKKPTIVSSLQTVGVVDPDPNAPCPDPDAQGACEVRTGDIIPDFAVDRSSGTLYAVWQDSRFSGGKHDDIAFSRSTDGGNTWSAPVKVNKTTNDAAAFTAAVHVRDDGTVAVTYYDFRNDRNGDATLDTDHWMVHSHDGGATWNSDESRLTPSSFDMRTAPYALGYFVGDYEGLDNAGNAFTPLFVTANNGNTANRTDALFRTAG
ncbi:MAG: exo-alpha-sialidase [Solirubrobacteraceae bacterium]